MDYTEARPASLAEEIDAFPLLLANGGPGIPPHNLAAVISTTVAYLDDPAISTAALIAQLTGPDFPTGGVVINGSALPAIYETGEGSILLRGRAKIEASGSERMIVITELPYTVSAAWDGGLIEQIADSVRGGSLAGISDLHDASSNDNGMQIVLELAPSSDPDATVDALYKQTDLEIAYQVRMVAAVDGTPRTLALRELIAEWVASRLRDQPKDAVRERLLAVAERHRDPRRTAIT
jgi:DNA gyrase subunit A